MQTGGYGGGYGWVFETEFLIKILSYNFFNENYDRFKMFCYKTNISRYISAVMVGFFKFKFQKRRLILSNFKMATIGHRHHHHHGKNLILRQC